MLSDKTLLNGLLLPSPAGSKDDNVGVLLDFENLKLDQLKREPGDELLPFFACGPLLADCAALAFLDLLAEGFSELKLNLDSEDAALPDSRGEVDVC